MRIEELFEFDKQRAKDIASGAAKGVWSQIKKDFNLLDGPGDEEDKAAEFNNKIEIQLKELVKGATLANTALFKQALNYNWSMIKHDQDLKKEFKEIALTGKATNIAILKKLLNSL